MIYQTLIKALAPLLKWLGLFLIVDNRAKKAERLKQSEAENDGNEKANETHNRVASDSDYRERVRRQFDKP